MKNIRRRRTYYLRIVFRSLLFIVCGLICFGIGVFGMRFCYKREVRKKEICISILNKDVEAGCILEAGDIKEVMVVNEKQDIKPITSRACIGKQTKIPLKKGTVLCEEILCEENALLENVRKIAYSYIKNADKLRKGDLIDIRISFPNGADFILLSQKEILSVKAEEGTSDYELWLALTEEEILRMSSGVVDAYLFDGAYIYATVYLNQMQEKSIVNYPVNEVVEELIKKDPNIIEIAQNQKTLELRSKIFENAVTKKENASVQEEGLVYFE